MSAGSHIDARDRYDSLIRYHVSVIWPELDWRLVKAQVAVESNFNASAISAAGARGLLQLMPATFREIRSGTYARRPITDPDANLAAGIRYLARQFERFPEVPDRLERLKFALAAYNCGRGYINRAIARFRFRAAGQEGHGPLTWELIRQELPEVRLRGRRPDYLQTWKYVARILGIYLELRRPKRPWMQWFHRIGPPIN